MRRGFAAVVSKPKLRARDGWQWETNGAVSTQLGRALLRFFSFFHVRLAVSLSPERIS